MYYTTLEASTPTGETTLAHGSTFTVPAGITVLRASFNQSGYLNLTTYVGVTPNNPINCILIGLNIIMGKVKNTYYIMLTTVKIGLTIL